MISCARTLSALRAPLGALALALAAAPVAAQELGTVTPLGSSCAGGAGGFPNSTCQRLRIQKAGIPSIDVDVRVIEPTVGVPYLGTVLIASGGNGAEYYAGPGGGGAIVQALLDSGLRVVDRRWSYGWFNSSAFVRPQSVRYATLLKWVYENVHTGGPFGVTGNSGGAAEIGYALTTWGSDSLVDVAVVSSGLILSRIDYLCTEPSAQTWASACPAIVPGGTMQCGTPPCTEATTNSFCLGYPSGITTQQLWNDSTMHPQADLSYPNTVVHMLFGGLDCTAAPPLGMLFHDSINALKSFEFVPNTPHEVYSTPAGREAIVTRLVNGMRAPLSVAYCTAGTSASGCAAQLGALGSASASAAAGFQLLASNVEGQKDGLFFFGTSGRQANPWGNGSSFQCVAPPVTRAGLLFGAGTSGTCDGAFAQDLNALWCPTCPSPSKNPGAGTTVQAELWYRDPQNTSNQTTSLSNALEFVVTP